MDGERGCKRRSVYSPGDGSREKEEAVTGLENQGGWNTHAQPTSILSSELVYTA